MAEFLNYPFDEGPLKPLDVKVLHGANYFSAGPVVILRLDLGRYDEVFTNRIPGFLDRLRALLPSLVEHHCSIGERGGFLRRVAEGTLLGHVTEHVAIELQTLAGMDVGYGKTRRTATQGVYNVVFRFLDEHVGLYTARAALNLVNAVLLKAPFEVDPVVDKLVGIREERLLGPSTQAVVDEAKRRGIPWLRLDEHNLVQLGSGRYQKRIRATITSETSLLAVETADNKHLTARMLADAGIPVPESITTEQPSEVIAFRERIGAPVVVKPRQGHLGQGVSVNLRTPAEIGRAVQWALRFDDVAVAQPLVFGESYRLLVIDYRFVAAVKLSPPVVAGDGARSVAELVAALNTDPDRGVGDKSRLTVVQMDDTTDKLLADRGYTRDSVPAAGETVPLQVSGSLRLGGISEDVTDAVHPVNRMLAERACRTLGLNVGGVDVVAPDIGRSIIAHGGMVVEVGAAPDFRMHLTPASGESRNVALPFVDMLFPSERETRVPVIAVTGTRGRTTAVKLIRQALLDADRIPGAATAEGLFAGGNALRLGDATRFESAAKTLKDPTIDCAVLEIPVETILDRGLGYDMADIGVVLNVRDEGAIYEEADSMEDIAYAHSVVAEQVDEEGFTVLNADDELVLEMTERLYSRPVLFSRRSDHPALKAHVERGGRAAVLDGREVLVLDGYRRIEIARLDDLPLASEAASGEGLEVVLAAAAALYCFGLSLDTIRETLRSFTAS